MAVDLQELAECIINAHQYKRGMKNPAPELTQQAIDDGVEVEKILYDGVVAGMVIVGERFLAEEYYMPEVLMAQRAMGQCMDILKPVLAARGVKPAGTVIVGTVQGDLHDIGKNLVAMMLQGNGFRVVDLGVDVSAEKFIAAAKESNADIIALSALLTTTMGGMKDVIASLSSLGVRAEVKVMIGGAPVTQKYADEIGADGYAPDAASAVGLAKKLVAAE